MPIFLPNIETVDFKANSEELWTKFYFPNCILAINGKHVRISNQVVQDPYITTMKTISQ